MAVKNYVLDTNVLLHDARAFYAFADNNVIIPIFVIEEIDTFKKDQSELGRNARQVARLLDQHRSAGLNQAQPMANGGTVRVALSKNPTKNPSYDSRSMDQRILEIALEVRDGDPVNPTILVTKDVNMRVRGDALGLQATDFEPEQIQIDELYAGNRDLLVPAGTIEQFYAEGAVVVDTQGLHANEFLTLKDDGAKSALTRWDKDSGKAVPVKKLREGVWGIKPRNKEQHFALDLLLNDDIKLVTLVGKAGTGKTLLAIAAGLQKVTEEQVFSKLLVSRPIFPLGRDIGYLPGDIEEKLNPWMQPIYDNLELLLGLNKSDKKDGRSSSELMELGFVEVEPLTYIRGRSLPNVYMIVDEAQNLTPHEVKTIITRAGEGTKIILTGDPYQIDHPYLDSSNNGLTTVAERFKNEAIAGHVILTKGERSPLAELATQILVIRAGVLAALVGFGVFGGGDAIAQPQPGWEVRLAERVDIVAGATGSLSLAIAVDRGLAVSKDAAVIVDVTPDPAVTVKRRRLGRTDAVDPEADTPRFAIPVRAETVGAFSVRVRVRFWVCAARTCRPIDVIKTSTVAVAAP